MRPPVLLLALSAGLSASPCFAQGAPPNPFASNYPSAPPAYERAQRVRAAPVRRRPPTPIEPGLLPPAIIPGR